MIIAAGACKSFASLPQYVLAPAGNSDVKNFAIYDIKIPEADFGDNGIDFSLRFSTNPSSEPDYLGRYWKIPLLDSHFVFFDSAKAIWRDPNRGSAYFYPASTSKPGAREYVDGSNEMRATFMKNGEVLIEEIGNPKCFFLYKDSRLVRFSPDGAGVFSVSYNSGKRPTAIYNATQRKTLASFKYRQGSKYLEKIVFEGGRTYSFDYTENPFEEEEKELKKIDLLKSILSPVGNETVIAYEDRAARSRTVVNKEFQETRTPKTPVRRMSMASPDSSGWIEWCGKTGIIMADDGGEYTTGNEAADELHPFYNKAGPAHMPPFIFVSYLKNGQKHPRTFFFDRHSAVKVQSDPNTGETYRHTLIGAKGPSYMSPRKVEKLSGGSDLKSGRWEPVKVNHYDNLGRLIRVINASGDIENFEYIGASNDFAKKLKNGILVFSGEKSGDELIRKFFHDNGMVSEIRTNEKKKESTYYFNGEIIRTEIFDGLRRVIKSTDAKSTKEYSYSGSNEEPDTVKEYIGGVLANIRHFENGKLTALENSQGKIIKIND